MKKPAFKTFAEFEQRYRRMDTMRRWALQRELLGESEGSDEAEFARLLAGRAEAEALWAAMHGTPAPQAQPQPEPRAATPQAGLGSVPKADPSLIGPYADFTDLRNKVREWAKTNIVGRTVTNAQTGQRIKINWRGIKHDLSNEYAQAEDQHLALTALPEMLEAARLVSRTPDAAGRAEIKAVWNYESEVDLGGRTLRAWLLVRETNAGDLFYDHGIITGGK